VGIRLPSYGMANIYPSLKLRWAKADGY
jgi:hypothetical protein